MSPFGPSGGSNPICDRRRTPTNDVYVMAAHIRGEVDVPPPERAERRPAKDGQEGRTEEGPGQADQSRI